MIVDMHCHLDLYPDPFSVAQICIEKGAYVLSVTTTPSAWNGTKKLALNGKRIQTALGLHPQIAAQRMHELSMFDSLLPSAKYVGEIGLDGSKQFKGTWDDQLKAFRHILNSVNQGGGRVMTIHARASSSVLLDELKNIDGTPVLHWFSGTRSELKRAIDMGCWFSVGPAMLTTKKGAQLVSEMPWNRVLPETDGPFAKYKGKPLLPWDVSEFYSLVSKIWSVPTSDLKMLVRENFRTLTAAA